MKIAITGGTGFIGKHLINYLSNQKHTLYILTRNPSAYIDSEYIKYVGWLEDNYDPVTQINELDAIINLAGKSINNRWTNETKKQIQQSRIQATKAVVQLVQTLHPHTLINASAIGYYGNSLDTIFTEEDQAGKGFLADTTNAWEAEASIANQYDTRVVYARFGIILDKDEGALPRIALPYQFFAGGKLGSGRQWMSWIHIKDVIKMIDFSLHNQAITGPLNITAPNPLRMERFGKNLANVLHRPYWLPAPSFALSALLGEMSELVLEGQHVLPQKALQHGYSFEFETLPSALSDIYQTN
ncbi:TIGR01777 family oxidoreductase [Bacillus solimangrovi]|uniref:TIGR01777 family protein n=1 Tax=Bacillus solimangrovi TaxID=1305675 RepID=A0A1E5LBB8_9BACI|nr:TIGR01777 family oxidoreductase [Bacillus solimangrovi]OEH91384.1 TIGR01777 family protein [Bacillus solimangrovi]